MKGTRILVAAAAVAAVTVVIGCGSSSDESAPSDTEGTIEKSASTEPLDGAQAALVAEGFVVEQPGAGQINADELDVRDGGALGDSIFTVLYYDDKNKALTEKDSIAQVFTGKFADRGIVEASPDQMVLYQVTQESSLSETQISEFKRLVSIVESSR